MHRANDEDISRLELGSEDDIAGFQRVVGQFETGSLPAAEFRTSCAAMGIYEQRESGQFMLRVRLPAGILSSAHVRAVADLASGYGDGTVHLTTRQDIQVHGVPLRDLSAALGALVSAGLSTKGGGGNTVRNITACDAGVCPEEVFDVSPWVVWLTQHQLRERRSFHLPRKFKIAFSGCSKDCAGATVHDVGFIAKRRDGIVGFAVYVGGGLGARSRVATLLEPFIPTADVYASAEAVKRVFDKHGERQNRHRARLRFLVEHIGLERFRELYRAELAHIHAPATPPLHDSAPPRPRAPAALWPREHGPGFEPWRKANVRPQKQAGYFAVEILPPLGLTTAAALTALAGIVEGHGEGVLRVTPRQNLVLRWVRPGELPALHRELDEAHLAWAPVVPIRHLVSCAGASTCRLGTCLSRGLAGAISRALAEKQVDLADARNLDLHISGCPNACGRHPIARIGFFGAVRRVEGVLAPHYILQLGGRVEEGRTALATGSVAIPARRVPDFLVQYLRIFRRSNSYPDFDAFLDAGGREIGERLAWEHAHAAQSQHDSSLYVDWDATAAFSPHVQAPVHAGPAPVSAAQASGRNCNDSRIDPGSD